MWSNNARDGEIKGDQIEVYKILNEYENKSPMKISIRHGDKLVEMCHENCTFKINCFG